MPEQRHLPAALASGLEAHRHWNASPWALLVLEPGEPVVQPAMLQAVE
jgi:hypothetical protein